jgi:ATP-dependent Clp protease protease subunit
LVLEADEVERVRTMLEEIFAEHTGRTPAQVRDDTERDLILPAQAALDYGVVDAVLTGRARPSG